MDDFNPDMYYADRQLSRERIDREILSQAEYPNQERHSYNPVWGAVKEAIKEHDE